MAGTSPRTRARTTAWQSCGAAAAVTGGGKSCSWGCLGYADCAVVCDFDAIVMSPNGLPVVDPEKCTACGDCVDACPLGLFVLMPQDHHLLVQCKNLLSGEAAEAVCSVACNACGRCAADAPGLITMVGGLAIIDYDKIELREPQGGRAMPHRGHRLDRGPAIRRAPRPRRE